MFGQTISYKQQGLFVGSGAVSLLPPEKIFGIEFGGGIDRRLED